jgi:hypothetical protein
MWTDATKESPLHDWFERLASGKGLCCLYADSYVIRDADWQSKDSCYRVRVPNGPSSEDMVWIDVPDDAVITEPNKAGRTMVWPLYGFGGISIRCFTPGSMTWWYVDRCGEIRPLPKPSSTSSERRWRPCGLKVAVRKIAGGMEQREPIRMREQPGRNEKADARS